MKIYPNATFRQFSNSTTESTFEFNNKNIKLWVQAVNVALFIIKLRKYQVKYIKAVAL